MKFTIAGLTAFATMALAHYNFEALIVNDEVTSPYEYVRKTTNSNSPIQDVTSDDMRCNQGGLDADIMAATSTYTVSGGDTVGFTVNVALSHPGPLHVYMSKAPDGTAAQDYDGSGDWFKVYSLTTSEINAEGLQWASYVGNGVNNFTFVLPEELAAGEYLMRAEHIGLHIAGSAQYFIGCAQLTVEGEGTGAPTDTVQIPSTLYEGTEPGLAINIYWPIPTSYTDPGPATWPSSCEDHTANFAGQASDGDCSTSSTSAPSDGSSSSDGDSSSGDDSDDGNSSGDNSSDDNSDDDSSDDDSSSGGTPATGAYPTATKNPSFPPTATATATGLPNFSAPGASPSGYPSYPTTDFDSGSGEDEESDSEEEYSTGEQSNSDEQSDSEEGYSTGEQSNSGEEYSTGEQSNSGEGYSTGEQSTESSSGEGYSTGEQSTESNSGEQSTESNSGEESTESNNSGDKYNTGEQSNKSGSGSSCASKRKRRAAPKYSH